MNTRFNGSDLFDGLRQGIRNLRLSLVESVFLIAALLFASLVAFYYFTRIQPRQSEIADLQRKIRQAEKTIEEQDQKSLLLRRQQEEKEKITTSLTDFEDLLKDRVTGQTQMIAQINQLAKEHQLMAPGFTFHPRGSEIASVTPEPVASAEPAGSPASSPAPTPKPLKLNQDLQIYPSLGIDTTVEGEYRNLRQFIYDLERSRQFLIIHAVAFQGVDEKLAALKGRGAPGAGANATVQNISLKIELDAYFQKPEGMRAFMYPAVNPASGKAEGKTAK